MSTNVGTRFEEIQAALKPLIALGWVAVNVQLHSDRDDGTSVQVVLRFEPERDHDIL